MILSKASLIEQKRRSLGTHQRNRSCLIACRPRVAARASDPAALPQRCDEVAVMPMWTISSIATLAFIALVALWLQLRIRS